MIRYEKVTWRQIIFLYALLAIYWLGEGYHYLEKKAEKFYFWLKYRNWRYDE